MLRIVMLVCVVVGIFLVVTRFTTIPNVPAIADRELIGGELGLDFIFTVCDDAAGYNEALAEKAWGRLLELYKKALV